MGFIAMLVFQLAGALILMINSLNGSREAVIRNCFPGSNIVERDDDDNCVLPKEDLRSSALKIYLNITAFLDLVIGYCIAAFSPCATYSTMYTVFIVLVGTVLTIIAEYSVSMIVACIQYREDMKIAYSELEKHGVETAMTDKEIDAIINGSISDGKHQR